MLNEEGNHILIEPFNVLIVRYIKMLSFANSVLEEACHVGHRFKKISANGGSCFWECINDPFIRVLHKTQ